MRNQVLELESFPKSQDMRMVECYEISCSVNISATGVLCSNPWSRSEKITIQRREEDKLEYLYRE